MSLLKKDKVPDELPELALPDAPESRLKPVATNSVPKQEVEPQIEEKEENVSSIPDLPKREEPIKLEPEKEIEPESTENKNDDEPEDSPLSKPIENSDINLEDIKSKIAEHQQGSSDTPKFFDKILDDINSGIQDLGKLEDWYKNKFSSQDIVSNMKGYWEGNKADIIIQSFGAGYKKKIGENIKNLQALEEDWRVIYFQLIKKEEEMKAVEQELKSTLAEFVDLCKRRNNEKESEKEAENRQEGEIQTEENN